MRINFPAERLDLPRCVNSGQVFRWEQISDGRWVGVDGAHWYVATPGTDHCDIETNGTAEDFRRLFRLDWDAEDVERRILAADPQLAPHMDALRGLRVTRPSSAEETFFSFLCTPNNNVVRITQMVRALASYGEPLVAVEGIQLHRFPRAEIIASIPEQELRERRFGYRAATITSAAKQLLSKPDGWLDSLRHVLYQEAHEELLSIKGIGRKLADCIALFGLDHTEAVPIDTHIWQQVVRLYRPDWQGKSLTEARYGEAGDLLRHKFGNLAGWAQQYLFYDNLVNWRSR